jgi:pyrroloquinoline quinone (PQQ) biosynthesis protein C
MVWGLARTGVKVTSRSVDLWSRLDDVHSRWNVLDHPFYRRWTHGELSTDELALYAGQYRHAVVALARAADSTARASESFELAAHAGEEAAHVSLWDAFAEAAGADGDAAAEPETAECADAWAGEDRDLLGHLVALYAIEAAQPAISRVKADGLRRHYGFAAGPGTAYFDLHAERDVEHAEDARALIAARLDGADEDALVAEAERVLRANWRLLDGVERLCAD